MFGGDLPTLKKQDSMRQRKLVKNCEPPTRSPLSQHLAELTTQSNGARTMPF